MFPLKRPILVLMSLITFGIMFTIKLKPILPSLPKISSFIVNDSVESILLNSTATSVRLPLPAIDPLIENDYKVNVDRRVNCNLRTPDNCHGTNKSLVITFWGQSSERRWVIINFLSVFPEKYFDYIIMIYDNSSWTHHPVYDKAIWIYVKNQIRFWYIKRFVSPHILRAYRYVWIIDDDAKFDFNTQAYECVVDQFNILLSAPARLTGPISYLITRISPHFTSKIGRWTDFVETGPLVIVNASALACIWNYISEKVSTGYGLDLIWCKILSAQCFPQTLVSKSCAILDAFAVDHDASGINSVDFGNAELPAYQKYYQNYKSKRLVFGAIATDSSVFDMCAEKLSTNQSFIV